MRAGVMPLMPAIIVMRVADAAMVAGIGVMMVMGGARRQMAVAGGILDGMVVMLGSFRMRDRRGGAEADGTDPKRD